MHQNGLKGLLLTRPCVEMSRHCSEAGNDTVCPLKFVLFKTYEVKNSEFRNSEATCNSKTFDFTYWGTFSA